MPDPITQLHNEYVDRIEAYSVVSNHGAELQNDRLNQIIDQLAAEISTVGKSLESAIHRQRMHLATDGVLLGSGKALFAEHVSAFLDYADDLAENSKVAPVEFEYEWKDDEIVITGDDVERLNNLLGVYAKLELLSWRNN